MYKFQRYIAYCLSKYDDNAKSTGQYSTTPTRKVQQPKRGLFLVMVWALPRLPLHIYAVGEDSQLAIDRLPESAFVRTFSEDAQVTDSAPSMGAYMTGEDENEVISMQTGTIGS